MADLVFYHAPQTRGAVVRWMLEEVGEPYDLKVLDLKGGDGSKPEYRKLNPQGKVPTLVHKGVPVTEVAAICTYLADEYPNAKLNVPVGNPERGAYLRWLFFSPSALEPSMMEKAFPRKEPPPPTAIGYRDLDTLLDVVGKAVTPGPYLMGEQFTTADVVVGSLLGYGTMFGMIPERPDTKAYLERLNARPAAKRANEADAALMKK